MKELEYPFDNGFIMKKKRSLKRQLLGDGAVRLKKRVAVLGGSTTDDIVSVLELFLLDMGLECEFYQSEYGQFWQDAVFSNEELEKLFDRLGIDVVGEDEVVTLWDLINEDNAGCISCVEADGETVFDIPENLKSEGMYEAE